MNERLAFVEAWKSRDFTLSALCRRFGISRKTGYKWINRVVEEGRTGLPDRSRAAHHRPNQTPDAVVQALIGQTQASPLGAGYAGQAAAQASPATIVAGAVDGGGDFQAPRPCHATKEAQAGPPTANP